MSIFTTPQPVTIRPQRKVGEFVATVTLEEIATDDLEITKHPVQQGAQISDHAYVKPAALALRLVFNADERPLDETYSALLELQAKREPFDVVTGKRIYKNMLIKGIGQTTDRETENVLAISLTLEEVLIVSVQITSVPPREKQQNAGKTGGTQNAGAKSAQPANDKPKAKSALKSLIG